MISRMDRRDFLATGMAAAGAAVGLGVRPAAAADAGARVYFNGNILTMEGEATEGTITAGKLADLVILDQDPLTVAPEAIRNIKVAETIKRGQTIFRRNTG